MIKILKILNEILNIRQDVFVSCVSLGFRKMWPPSLWLNKLQGHFGKSALSATIRNNGLQIKFLKFLVQILKVRQHKIKENVKREKNLRIKCKKSRSTWLLKASRLSRLSNQEIVQIIVKYSKEEGSAAVKSSSMDYLILYYSKWNEYKRINLAKIESLSSFFWSLMLQNGIQRRLGMNLGGFDNSGEFTFYINLF